MLSTALEISGVLALAAGLGFMYWPLALLPIGLYLLAAGMLLDHTGGDE